jgi:protocatechuate 3,4-dioxygenase beta subunit
VSELVFRVERGYEMLGRVRAEDGELPKSLRVSARPSPEEEGRRDEEESSELPTASAQRVRHAFCEPDGTFAVRGLQPDTRYALSLWVRDTEAEAVEDGPPRKSWKLARGTERIHGFSGQRGLEIVFRPEAALLFRVTDAASGLPLTEFTVSAGIGNERVLRDDADKARRAFEDGRVRYGGLRPKRGGKPVHLRVAAAGFADHERKDIVLAPAQTLDLGEIALARERVVIARAVDDRTGEPIEGARIVLGTKTEKELKQILANQPGEDLFGIQTVRFGRTDASGAARLSSYPGKSATAVADAKGRLASAPVSVFLPQGEDKAIELRLRRGGTVVVTVRDRTGRPMEGIGVERRDPSGSQSRHSNNDGENTIRTDADGVVRFEALEPGAHAFRATDQALPQNAWYSGRRQENNEGWVEAVATEGATVSLDFTVESRGGLSGHVREGGLPLAGARLRLVEPEKAGGNRMVFWGGQNDPLATLTDVNGEYRFSKVRAGPYVLEITHGSRKMVARQPVVVEAPPRVLEIDLDVAIIEGRVVGEDRNPIEGIEVQCLNEKNQNESQGSWRVLLSEDEEGDTDVDYRQDATRREKTDANGRYVLRGVRSGEALKIQATGDTVQPETKEAVTLGPDEIRRNVDFVLKDAGAIEVVMTGASSRRGRGWFQVRATQIVEEGKVGQTSYANLGSWNPTAVVRSLPPGRFRVQVFVGGRQQGEAVLDQEVEVVVRQVVRVSFSAP